MPVIIDGTTGITTPGLTNTGTETIVNLTTTGNTILGDASTDTLNVGNGGLIKDASGNLGLGVTPSAWTSGFKAVQIGANGSFYADGTGTYWNNNWYINSSLQAKYLTTNTAQSYEQAGGKHAWYIAPSGTAGNTVTFTQAMTLDASGRLMVGVTSNINSSTVIQAGGIINARIGIDSPDSQGFYFTKSSANNGTYRVDTNGNFEWYTKNVSQAMTLDASGNLLVASTASSPPTAGGFSITPEGQGAGTPAILRWNKSASGNYYAAQFMYSGSIVGSIEVSNTATAFVTSSDYRLKENIAPMTGALSVVQQLKPCTYTWKSEGSVGQGFIAHELQAIVPDAVVGEKDAVNEDGSIKPQGIDTSFLVATLTAAIQEQQALIQTLTARITALEGAA